MYKHTSIKGIICFIRSALQIEKDIKVSLTLIFLLAVKEKKVKQVNQKTFRFKTQLD